jgi:quercetin dioxygenase-like cupin family protein
MSKLLATILLAAAALVPASASANNQTPPGTCMLTYAPHAIPGYPDHRAFGVHMNIYPGRVANWHSHNAVEYLTVTSGSGWLEYDNGSRVTLAPNRTVMIPARKIHRAHNSSTAAPLVWNGLFVGIRPDSSFTALNKGERAWTPGCPYHF